MSVELKVDHLSRREQFMLSLVYVHISAREGKKYAAETVNHIVSSTDEIEPVVDGGGK